MILDRFPSRARLLAVLLVSLWPAAAHSAGPSSDAEPEAGPPLNPFECYGRWENATGNRTVEQMNHELAKLMRPLYKPSDPRTRRAIKACTVGRLMARVGDGDAYKLLQEAIRWDPEEPGYELWAGDYWASFRGSVRPVHSRAEAHFYRALSKLEAKKKNGSYQDYHRTVESWVQKKLMKLYQEDGLPLTPWWKSYRYEPGGLNPPGVFVSSELAVSKDTRDFFRNNEFRVFSSEAAFANSGVRAGGTTPPIGPGPLTEEQRKNIIRTPLRYQLDNRIRIRQNHIGYIDLLHSVHRAEDAQITSYYLPNEFNDVEVQEFGVGVQRQFALDPLFDLRLKGTYKRVARTGVVEFLPDETEDINFYEFKPSISRFIGSDKLTLSGTYVLMDIPDLPGGSPSGSKRGHWIVGGELNYALYAPIVMPFTSTRTPTRGWYFFGGYVASGQIYGLRTVFQQDAYLGTRLETPTDWDITLQATYYSSNTSYVDENDPALPSVDDSTQRIKSLRASAVISRRIINPDKFPGVQDSTAGFAADMMNVVVPLSWDVGLQGPTAFGSEAVLPAGQTLEDFGIDGGDHTSDYENVRGGVELWFKLYGTGIGGTGILSTIGYDAQYFYNLDRLVHTAHANLRVGWGDFL